MQVRFSAAHLLWDKSSQAVKDTLHQCASGEPHRLMTTIEGLEEDRVLGLLLTGPDLLGFCHSQGLEVSNLLTPATFTRQVYRGFYERYGRQAFLKMADEMHKFISQHLQREA